MYLYFLKTNIDSNLMFFNCCLKVKERINNSLWNILLIEILTFFNYYY
jgi:hypothetical protein